MENLEKLSSPELLSRLKTAARDERLLQVRVLELLREANRRRLFAAKGYRSLFEFCVKELGYAESAAYRRISAMKLIDDVPEIREKLASGQLNLSHLTSAQSFIQSEARFANKTFSSAEKAALITSLENKTAKEAEMLLATLSPSALPRERERTLTPEETEIRFVANAPLKGKLDKLKDLNSHRDPSRSYQKLFDWLSDLGLRQADPLMKKARSRPTGPQPKGHYRHIPAAPFGAAIAPGVPTSTRRPGAAAEARASSRSITSSRSRSEARPSSTILDSTAAPITNTRRK